MTTLNKI